MNSGFLVNHFYSNRLKYCIYILLTISTNLNVQCICLMLCSPRSLTSLLKDEARCNMRLKHCVMSKESLVFSLWQTSIIHIQAWPIHEVNCRGHLRLLIGGAYLCPLLLLLLGLEKWRGEQRGRNVEGKSSELELWRVGGPEAGTSLGWQAGRVFGMLPQA